MGITINVVDDANVELDDVNITVAGDSIQFDIAGEITDMSSNLLEEVTGEKLSPVEITFETE